jgi:hypothetical protein
MSSEKELEEEKKLWKTVEEDITKLIDDRKKYSRFAKLFRERADENAMKIWNECFREVFR